GFVFSTMPVEKLRQHPAGLLLRSAAFGLGRNVRRQLRDQRGDALLSLIHFLRRRPIPQLGSRDHGSAVPELLPFPCEPITKRCRRTAVLLVVPFERFV